MSHMNGIWHPPKMYNLIGKQKHSSLVAKAIYSTNFKVTTKCFNLILLKYFIKKCDE